MNYTIDIPRKTFDGLCRHLQLWGQIYSAPGAVVLKGMMRNERGQGDAVSRHDAPAVALRFNTALNGLGRCRVTKAEAFLDLRDLSEEEQDALLFVTKLARLKPQQTKVLERFQQALIEWLKLPAMMRIAIAAAD